MGLPRMKMVSCVFMVTVLCLESVLGQENIPVEVKWGVADSTATVGRLFRMHIPSDAFSGSVLSYTVRGSDGSPLPDWLEFDVKDNVLQGIPAPKDSGQLFLEVTAKGVGSMATVSFTVFVRDVPSHTSGAPLKFKTSGPEFVRCKSKEPETVATIILDADLEGSPVSDRVALLKRFLSHMDLHEDMVKMVPVGNSPMHDSSALVSGTGDCVAPKTSGLFISWPVGCGQVKEGHFPVLQRLDDDSGSGHMAKILGYSVIGWQVTNSHIQAPTRKRRQIQPTATPAVTPIMPTKTDTTAPATDDTEEKMTHKMVDTSSPTFIQPTATEPPMTKTDEPEVTPPTVKPDKPDQPDKIMPTEATPMVPPVTKTKEMPPIKPTRTYEPSEPTDVPTIDVKPGCVPGLKPEVKEPIQRLTYHVGEVIDFVIPVDTFEDCEVGGTRGLELLLFEGATEAIKPDFFLQLDSKQQRLMGLPMDGDTGRYKFNLVARKKSNGLLAAFEFNFHVKPVKGKRKINHELSVTVDYDYNTFMSNVQDRIKLANNVASVYGDADSSNLVITKIAEGSVIYSWTNSSLSSGDCPSGEITELVRKLVNEDGTLSDNAIKKLKPFVLLGAAAQPSGACEGDDSFPVVVSKPRGSIPDVDDDDGDKDDMTPTMKPTMKPDEKMAKPDDDDDDDDDDDKKKPGEATDAPKDTTEEDVAKGSTGGDDEDDIWITTVVPAVVIVVILLIALLIACILYRKKRKGKMNVEEQNTFINKGAPVIFPDELEEKPSDVNKPLLVEGSPAPPEYHRGTSESPEPHVANNHRNNANNAATAPTDDGITEMPEKPYEPPPPVTASSNNKQPRPTHQQQPFSQPPQILP